MKVLKADEISKSIFIALRDNNFFTVRKQKNIFLGCKTRMDFTEVKLELTRLAKSNEATDWQREQIEWILMLV